MRRDNQGTVFRRGTTARSSGGAGDHQRTTLSFLVATFAVAVSASLGLGQAAASATATGSIDVAAPDPAHPVADLETTVVASEDLLAALSRLERLPETIAESSSLVASSTTRRTDVSISEVPVTSSTSEPITKSSTSNPEPEETPVGAGAATTSTTVRPTTVTAPPETMAVREWHPITNASFRRFVEMREFTTVDYITPGLVHGTMVANNQSINVVLVHRSATAPMRVSPRDRGREHVGDWAKAIGATAGINANWYNPWDGPAVAGGRAYGGSDHEYTALFGFTADGDLIADHHRKVHNRVDPRVVEAVSGHPTLIHRGGATTDFGVDPTFTNRHPRTVIGVSATVDVLILVTVDGRRSSASGMTGAETARLLQGLGAHDAVMLDGGGSSAMWIAGKGIVNRQSEPGRAVGNQIAVFGR